MSSSFSAIFSSVLSGTIFSVSSSVFSVFGFSLVFATSRSIFPTTLTPVFPLASDSTSSGISSIVSGDPVISLIKTSSSDLDTSWDLCSSISVIEMVSLTSLRFLRLSFSDSFFNEISELNSLSRRE
ncbi:hypothetical protein ES705_30420 [subsurface metagenome]